MYDSITIKDTNGYFLERFKMALKKNGIACYLNIIKEKKDINYPRTLCKYTSKPVIELLKNLNKNSDNQYAEAFIKTLSYKEKWNR